MPRLHYRPGVLTIDLGAVALQFYLASGACFAIDYAKSINYDQYPKDKFGPEIGMDEANGYFRQWAKRKDSAEMEDEELFADIDVGLDRIETQVPW